MHTVNISASEMIKMLHWQFFHSILVTVGISLIKLSMARFLLRLVPGKTYKYFLYGMIGKHSKDDSLLNANKSAQCSWLRSHCHQQE